MEEGVNFAKGVGRDACGERATDAAPTISCGRE
jgi:hypothetical protein